jgi:YHS domain-containing protein
VITAVWLGVFALLVVAVVATRGWARDPVCGHRLRRRDAAATRVQGGTTYYLCSTFCRFRFDRHPAGFVPSTPAPPGPLISEARTAR